MTSIVATNNILLKINFGWLRDIFGKKKPATNLPKKEYIKTKDGNKYEIHRDIPTPSGRPAIDNGDAVSECFRGLKMEQVCSRGAQLLTHFNRPTTKQELLDKYSHLSPAMKRMCIGNNIRGAIRRAGHDPKVVELPKIQWDD